MTYYRKFKAFLSFYKAPLFSGLLFGLSFIPFPFLAWFFCLVPLWLFLYKQKSLKPVLIACLLTQSIATLIGFNWMIYVFHVFAHMPWTISAILLILFCCVANIYVLISGWLWYFLSQKTRSAKVKLLLLPLLFSIFHNIIPTLFPWNMGYPWLWGGLWGAQTAELWGFRFLNTLFYVFNLLFMISFYHIKKNKKPQSFFKRFSLDNTGLKALLTAVCLFAFLNILGYYLKQRLTEPDKSLKVLVVQHNINLLNHKDFKPYRSVEQKTLSALSTLTYNGLKQARKQGINEKEIDFILWPEAAYPYAVKAHSKKIKSVSKMIRLIKIPLMTGGISYKTGEVKNSLFVLNKKGEIQKPTYSKVKLVLFGEYFPLIGRSEFLKKHFPFLRNQMQSGDSFQVTELEGIRYGFQICYESLFDSISRELAHKKAQVLVNVTNDSWYGFWQQPYQHLVMNFSRAIEVRRPLIRSTNTGFSGVILADGSLKPFLFQENSRSLKKTRKKPSKKPREKISL